MGIPTKPPADNLDVLKNTWVTNVRTYDMDKKGETHYRKFKRYTIPISWWEPMAKWISETRWSIYGLCDAADGTPKHHLRATWTELLLAFQIQTGYRFHDELDLASLEKAFKIAFRKLMNITVLKLNGRRRTTQQIWNMVPAINSLKEVIGHPRAGICRRPILPDNVWNIVVNICTDALRWGNCKTTFGIGYRIRLPNNKLIK